MFNPNTNLQSPEPVSGPQPYFEDIRVARLSGPKASILDTVGRTPVVKLNHIATNNVSVFVKLEAFNPLGSVKDRLALAIIDDAENSGALAPGQTLVEATSGNTGIGLAMCAPKRARRSVRLVGNTKVVRTRWFN
jgi:cysteine synthase A